MAKISPSSRPSSLLAIRGSRRHGGGGENVFGKFKRYERSLFLRVRGLFLKQGTTLYTFCRFCLVHFDLLGSFRWISGTAVLPCVLLLWSLFWMPLTLLAAIEGRLVQVLVGSSCLTLAIVSLLKGRRRWLASRPMFRFCFLFLMGSLNMNGFVGAGAS